MLKLKKIVLNGNIFEKFEEEIGQNLEPYRTEWMIWDKELKFAGSIDMIFRNPDGTLLIYDWKRCKNIKKDNRWQGAVTDCISHLLHCKNTQYHNAFCSRF